MRTVTSPTHHRGGSPDGIRSKMSFAIATLSDTGRVRSHNEDAAAEFERASGHRLLVVADGMGGHRGGATASRVAVEAIGAVFQRSTLDPELMLREAMSMANERVHRMSAEDPELRGMGTTVVSLFLGTNGSGFVAHIGDSRAYCIRGGQIEALTSDHSVVGQMVRQGLITTTQAAVHPRRNEILRSVGVEAAVEPELRAVSLQSGDRFLLCSDGLSGMLSDEEIAAVVRREDPARAVQTLVEAANTRGGTDNITVQIVAILESAGAGARVPSPSALDSPTGSETNAQGLDGSGMRMAAGVAIALVLAALLWWAL